mmetsp:Transcript_41013/g.131134  ORF Transcript_41013/g.131134 Transcript_41013/m.131134 type:complete len:203 (+) Transcript_41013:456-1064(+)
MMLCDREDNLVALPEVRQPPGVRHEVDGLAGVARVHDLPVRRRIDELGHLAARRLISISGLGAQHVHAPVHVRVVPAVVVSERIKHLLGLLRCGGIVEVDEGAAVALLVEDGEVLPDLVSKAGGRLHRQSGDHGSLAPLAREAGRGGAQQPRREACVTHQRAPLEARRRPRGRAGARRGTRPRRGGGGSCPVAEAGEGLAGG